MTTAVESKSADVQPPPVWPRRISDDEFNAILERCRQVLKAMQS